MTKNTFFSNKAKKITSLGYVAIASMAFTINTCGLFLPCQSIQASEQIPIVKEKQSQRRVVKIAGNYQVVLEPQVMEDARKEGIVSFSGKWTINPDGSFVATLETVNIKSEVQTIRTTGKVRIVNGKVVSQVETLNGEKPNEPFPTQSYTLLSDGKTLQADDQPVKLVRQ